MTKSSRSVLWCSIGASALAWSTRTQASPTFPQELRARLQLSGTPDCTLCHRSNAGGKGTVTTPFGRSLLSEGATGSDTASLDAALENLARLRRDSDGDGATDIDELRAGNSPNDPSDGPPPPGLQTDAGADPDAGLGDIAQTPVDVNRATSTPIPETGCALGARVIHTPWTGAAGWICAVAGWLIMRRRRQLR